MNIMHQIEQFEEVLEPFGKESISFFLAASLYFSHKVSFARAAELSGLSFGDFQARLREHFQKGFFLTEETMMDDLAIVEKLQQEK